MYDDLGDRMKDYEINQSIILTQHVPVIARIDGRAFHTFTANLERPYDARLSNLMANTTKYLLEKTHAKIGYTQSDEISLLFYAEEINGEIFFSGKVQKMASNLASLTTAYFNRKLTFNLDMDFPTFDCRVFSLPNKDEVANYFIWREQDAVKNSISMAAQSVYSHKELIGKNGSEKQEMLHKKGINWNNYPYFFKRGTYLQRQLFAEMLTPEQLLDLPEKHNARKNPNQIYARAKVVRVVMPILTTLDPQERIKRVFNDRL